MPVDCVQCPNEVECHAQVKDDLIFLNVIEHKLVNMDWHGAHDAIAIMRKRLEKRNLKVTGRDIETLNKGVV